MKKIYVTPIAEFEEIEGDQILAGSQPPKDPPFEIEPDDPTVPGMPIGGEEEDEEDYDYSL